MSADEPTTEPPLVSAVIIFCNEERFLAEAVESVKAQTMTDWELLLVDDGSTDTSAELARTLAADDPTRIRHLTHPDHERRGMSASRNLGVGAANGRYVAYLDADDRWLPDKLERQLDQLASQPQARLVYGPLQRWYSWTGRAADQGRDDLYGLQGHRFRLEPGTLLEPPRLAELLLEHKDLVPSGALFERSLFLEVGGAEDRFTDNYEDAVVFLKMGLRATAHVGDRAGYLYRQYPQASDRAERAVGRPDADRLRGDAARAVFLDWAEDHLRAEGRWEGRMRRAVGRARKQMETASGAGPRPVVARSLRTGGATIARAATVAGRAGRLGARHGRLIAGRRLRRLPIEQLTDEFAFSLGPGGWEPLRAALDGHRREPQARPEETPFGRFLLDPITNDVRDLNDLLGLSDRPSDFADLPRFWLGTYPWGGIGPDSIGRPGPAFGWAHDAATGADTAELWGRGRTMWYRPDDRLTIAAEWDRTIALDRSIAEGYRPHRARGFPLVTLLRHDDGRERAVIVDGHHRLSVLANRGATRVTVEIGAIVERASAATWYHVRDGRCTTSEARRFFDAFFELDGSERFRLVSAGWERDRVG